MGRDKSDNRNSGRNIRRKRSPETTGNVVDQHLSLPNCVAVSRPCPDRSCCPLAVPPILRKAASPPHCSNAFAAVT
jgi:hypothetical protein